jgi:hypothetical protein
MSGMKKGFLDSKGGGSNKKKGGHWNLYKLKVSL